MIPVSYKRIREGVSRPTYHTNGSVGFDLAAAEDTIVRAGEIALIPTGLVVRTPPGYMLILVPRSSTPKKHSLTMPHSIGIIDQDYAGDTDELLIQVSFDGQTTTTDSKGNTYPVEATEIKIEKGTRIAQGLFVPVQKAVFKEVTDSAESRGGFGSTG